MPAVVAGFCEPCARCFETGVEACFRGDRELALFLAATGLVSANDQGRPSHPSRSPKRQLDFILYSPELEASNFNIPMVHFSDHVPLVCDFALKAAG